MTVVLSGDVDEIRFYVRFALDIQLRAGHEADPQPTIDAGFRLLDDGWTRYRKSAGWAANPRRKLKPRWGRA